MSGTRVKGTRLGGSAIDLRLVWPAAACWAAAGVLVTMPEHASGAAAVLGAVAVTVLAAAGLAAALRPAGSGRRRVAGWGAVAVCCTAAALAASAVAVQAPDRLPDAIRALAADHGQVHTQLTVSSAPVPSSTTALGGGAQLRFRAILTGFDTRGGNAPTGPESGSTGATATTGLSVPVVVFVDASAAADDAAGAAPAGSSHPADRADPADPAAPADPPDLDIGDEIRLTGTLAGTDPGDAASALLFGRGSPEPVRAAPWWLDWADQLRHGFAAAAGRLPGNGAGLLPGLAIGDTTAVGDDLDAAMKASSLSHLTAVSGANCAVVLALVLVATAALGLGRVWRVAAGLVVLAGFVVLVTPEPSVVRAAGMATIVLLSGALGRPGR
ncbi:MAG: ComEC/Rec2 family competence protein, partial [Cryobacterium sp.]